MDPDDEEDRYKKFVERRKYLDAAREASKTTKERHDAISRGDRLPNPNITSERDRYERGERNLRIKHGELEPDRNDPLDVAEYNRIMRCSICQAVNVPLAKCSICQDRLYCSTQCHITGCGWKHQ